MNWLKETLTYFLPLLLLVVAALVMTAILLLSGCSLNTFEETPDKLFVSRWTFLHFSGADSVEVVSETSSVSVGRAVTYPDANSLEAMIPLVDLIKKIK